MADQVETPAQVEARERLYQQAAIVLGTSMTVGDKGITADTSRAHPNIGDVLKLAGFVLQRNGVWTKPLAKPSPKPAAQVSVYTKNYDPPAASAPPVVDDPAPTQSAVPAAAAPVAVDPKTAPTQPAMPAVDPDATTPPKPKKK